METKRVRFKVGKWTVRVYKDFILVESKDKMVIFDSFGTVNVSKNEWNVSESEMK